MCNTEIMEDLSPIDILAFATEQLQSRYDTAKTLEEKYYVFEEFLDGWGMDPSFESIRNWKFEFAKDLDWYNVNETLSLSRLRGKIVVLDFFTYCCINCLHVLPDLRALEERFPVQHGLVVVGVHSPKFENEKVGANILSAIKRNDIRHPVVNDPQSTLWRSIGIHCWPTLFILDPTGLPILLLMGEGHGRFLGDFIGCAIRYFDEQEKIENFLLPLQISTEDLPASKLRFPAKIAKSRDGRYAIADAGNNRILVIDASGVVLSKIGGCSGLIDGTFETSRFNCPQGVTFLDEDILLVADTENHAVRRITLSKNLVETIVGTGQQGNDRQGGNVGYIQKISSPWDVEVFRTRDMDMSFHLDERNVPEKNIVLIAMAGTHQIWGYFPEGIIWWKFRKFDPCTCVSLIGNGLEENRNNSYPQNAAFAQPSGLALANEMLFIADSESSSIRKVSMIDGKVSAVAGGDRNPQNLFAFGDVDGKQYSAKLQHPLAIAYNWKNDSIYIADTYNHKIKMIDSTSNIVSTLNIRDDLDRNFKFNEPAGLCFDLNCKNLLVSDTNNHSIQIVDMQTLKCKPLQLDFTKLSSEFENVFTKSNEVKLVKNITLPASNKIKIVIHINLEADLKYSAEAPQRWSLKYVNPVLLTNISTGSIRDGTFELQLQRSMSEKCKQEELLKLDLTLNLCDSKCCLIKRFVLVICNESETTSCFNSHLDDSMVINVGIEVCKTGIMVK